MLDYRVQTFLTLCDYMHYGKTADKLHITQPAVTQHIQSLEQEYNCKLFVMNARKLEKTHSAVILEKYARIAYANTINFKNDIKNIDTKNFKIGASKTIGDYVLPQYVKAWTKDESLKVEIFIENTKELLDKLNHSKIDVAIIEGFFDKSQYDYMLLKKENFIGICGKNHRFSGKTVTWDDIFKEYVILREDGSGTNAVLEKMLEENNYSLDNFKQSMLMNSIQLILNIVSSENCISFIYESAATCNESIGIFKIKDTNIKREFNYVWLKDTNKKEILEYLELPRDK